MPYYRRKTSSGKRGGFNPGFSQIFILILAFILLQYGYLSYEMSKFNRILEILQRMENNVNVIQQKINGVYTILENDPKFNRNIFYSGLESQRFKIEDHIGSMIQKTEPDLQQIWNPFKLFDNLNAMKEFEWRLIKESHGLRQEIVQATELINGFKEVPPQISQPLKEINGLFQNLNDDASSILHLLDATRNRLKTDQIIPKAQRVDPSVEIYARTSSASSPVNTEPEPLNRTGLPKTSSENSGERQPAVKTNLLPAKRENRDVQLVVSRFNEYIQNHIKEKNFQIKTTLQYSVTITVSPLGRVVYAKVEPMQKNDRNNALLESIIEREILQWHRFREISKSAGNYSYVIPLVFDKNT